MAILPLEPEPLSWGGGLLNRNNAFSSFPTCGGVQKNIFDNLLYFIFGPTYCAHALVKPSNLQFNFFNHLDDLQ